MNRLIVFGAVVVTFALFSTSCNQKPQPVPAPKSDVHDAVNLGPVTEEEALQFARDLEQAARECAGDKVESLLRTWEFNLRLIDNLSLEEEDRKEFEQIFTGRPNNRGMGGGVLREMENGGSYKLLRIHEVNGRWRAFFRLLGSDDSINYHDYSLLRYSDGKIGMEDVYLLADGEMMSEANRRLAISKCVKPIRGKILTETEKEYAAHSSTISAMIAAVLSKDFDRATVNYRKLPTSLQNDKTVMLIWMKGLSRGVEEMEYIAAMNKFRSLYPNDACIDFWLIDYYTVKKEFDSAMNAIDRVDKFVGGDPHLAVMRANLFVDSNRFDEARRLIDQALKQEPDLVSAHWSRITLSLRRKHHAETLEWLKKIVQTCGEDIADLTEVPDYADFVKSPQHAEWLKWYAENKK